ncbi:MAG: serine/threonine-protein kinase, partial [Candidatus Eremiobacterota bacterium]
GEHHAVLFRKAGFLDATAVASPDDLRGGHWPRKVVLQADDTVRLLFVTDPAGAQVYLFEESLRHREKIGVSGQPIEIKKSVLWNAEKQELIDPMVAFELQGYYLEPVVADGVTRTGRWPAAGAYYLKAQNPYTGPLEVVRRFGVLLLGLLAVALWAAGRMQKQKREQRLEVDRKRRLEEISQRGRGEAWTGARVGPWRLIGKLGEGKATVVYRAVPDDTLSEADMVAVKLLSPETLKNEDVRQRFQREMGLGARLDHPNICQVVDYGDQDGSPYLAMEFIHGKPLRWLIKPEGLPLQQVAEWAMQVAEALQYAHGQGVLHRNLKPENLMVTEHGRIKVMDFSVAQASSPPYAPPGETASKRSDQYALGVTLYELLTGRLPFEPPDRTYAPLSRYRSGLPDDVETVVSRMLDPDPTGRFEDVVTAARALNEAIPSPAAPASSEAS